MKIKYLTEKGLMMVRSNTQYIANKIVKEKNFNVIDIFQDADIVSESPYDLPDFRLDMSQEKGKEALTDLENIKRVYNNMRGLSDSLASDERLWSAFTLVDRYDYMQYRWKVNSENDLKNRYLFSYSAHRSLFRNGMSRLWWIGRVTYDESREDPYELTEFLISRDQDYAENICGRNVFNNPKVTKATIAALLDSEKDGIKIDRFLVREIAKYMNLLAGTYLLDSMDYDELNSKAKERILKLKE
ncbi:MAG: DUF6339 family protein [Vallitaleaceae bacterium]|nr:DUF6339 family protein [Vallitaleaceae bacterium]